jgi:transcriptional regulator with XRE-family HTH domain
MKEWEKWSKVRRTISDDFGSMIRRLRESKGYSTQTLGELANITPSYVNRLERGLRKRPTIIIIEDLASALGVDMEVLLSTCSNRNQMENLTLEQLLYSRDFSIRNGKPINSEAKELLLVLVDTINDAEWERETMVEDMHEILRVVDQLKEQMEQ